MKGTIFLTAVSFGCAIAASILIIGSDRPPAGAFFAGMVLGASLMASVVGLVGQIQCREHGGIR